MAENCFNWNVIGKPAIEVEVVLAFLVLFIVVKLKINIKSCYRPKTMISLTNKSFKSSLISNTNNNYYSSM